MIAQKFTKSNFMGYHPLSPVQLVKTVDRYPDGYAQYHEQDNGAYKVGQATEHKL